MKYQLYYTTEIISDNKIITVYEIINNVPKIFCEIETSDGAMSENEIQEYLDNNGYEDKEFEFTNL